MLLQEDSRSTREVQTEYNEQFEESMRRESVHRGLENLRDAGILTRVYDEEENHFKYEPATDSVVIDLTRMIVDGR